MKPILVMLLAIVLLPLTVHSNTPRMFAQEYDYESYSSTCLDNIGLNLITYAGQPYMDAKVIKCVGGGLMRDGRAEIITENGIILASVNYAATTNPSMRINPYGTHGIYRGSYKAIVYPVDSQPYSSEWTVAVVRFGTTVTAIRNGVQWNEVLVDYGGSSVLRGYGSYKVFLFSGAGPWDFYADYKPGYVVQISDDDPWNTASVTQQGSRYHIVVPLEGTSVTLTYIALPTPTATRQPTQLPLIATSTPRVATVTPTRSSVPYPVPTATQTSSQKRIYIPLLEQ